MGQLDEVPIKFEAADDVAQGGVLCALPALITLGLLNRTREMFTLSKGFYPLETIFIVLAFIALVRIRSLDALRYEKPGEWGRLLGLDRIPEVKTIREKLAELCNDPGRVQRWSGDLAKEWMEADPQAAGTCYIDGHVRVYHGSLTKLPRRHVAREKLFLRGTTDYWVNAMDGQPFFVVTKPIDPGLTTVLRDEIVPRLKKEIPNQPTEQELENHPRKHRFSIVFDRAAYSPKFFKEMLDQRVAILTYHKFPQEAWHEEEFLSRTVQLVNGEKVTLRLAERGTQLSNKMWVREIRNLDRKGHQTSILSTDFESPLEREAAAMFARWCQENFFKYMLQNYGLDRILQFGTEAIPETTRLVNPAWRTLDSKVRREAVILSREKAEFGEMGLPVEVQAKDTAEYEVKKGKLLQEIQQRQLVLDKLKTERKAIAHHIEFKDLPKDEKFDQLRGDRKHLVDTIKMISYRAETCLVHIASEAMRRSKEDARSWVQALLRCTVNLRPDHDEKTLTVQIHRQTTSAQEATLRHVCEQLTATETVYPGTNLRMIFTQLGSS